MPRRATVALSILVLAALHQGARADFEFQSFTLPDHFAFNGAARLQPGVLSLTGFAIAGPVAGSVWHVDQQTITGNWSTSFSFDMPAGGYDGLAFVIQDVGTTALGGKGGALGYATNLYYANKPDQAGIPQSLAIEFDTFDNTGAWPEAQVGHHVSVQTQGLMPNSPAAGASIASAPAPINQFGQQYLWGFRTVRVTYESGVLRVYMDQSTTPLLSVAIDIAAAIGAGDGRAYVGFTAASRFDQQLIRGWSWKTN